MPRNSCTVPAVVPRMAPSLVLTTGAVLAVPRAAVAAVAVVALAWAALSVATTVPRAMAPAHSRATARQPVPVLIIFVSTTQLLLSMALVNAAATTVAFG
jgi:hypothetical protein